jgi:hypothetical protein
LGNWFDLAKIMPGPLLSLENPSKYTIVFVLRLLELHRENAAKGWPEMAPSPSRTAVLRESVSCDTILQRSLSKHRNRINTYERLLRISQQRHG